MQPTSVFLPGESHGQRNLGGYSPWGRKESAMTEWPSTNAFRWVYLSSSPLQRSLAGNSPIVPQRVRHSWSHLAHMNICRHVLSLTGLLLLQSHFSRVWPHRRQPTRLPRPWDSPGKNTEVGCHFLLQCIKVKSESEVAQSCPTLSDPMDCSLPGSSIHGIFQARVLEWGSIVLKEHCCLFIFLSGW